MTKGDETPVSLPNMAEAPATKSRRNPILEEFRDDPWFSNLIDRAASYIEVNMSDMSQDASVWTWSSEDMEHARRVLSRLIAVARC